MILRRSAKTALVVHIYHLDVWAGIAQRLEVLQGQWDLHLTLSEVTAKQVDAELKARFPVAQVHVFPNQGMDTLPFLRLVPHLVEQGYQQLLKLHTKKGTSGFGQQWGECLIDALIGHPDAVAHAEAAFAEEPQLALLGPAPFYLSGKKLMLKNQQQLLDLAQAIAQPSQPIKELPSHDWGFFAGSMFWTQPSYWLTLAKWAEANAAAFETVYAQDGQLPHAVERAFGLMPALAKQPLGLLHSTRPGKTPYLEIQPAQQLLINQAGSQKLIQAYQTLKENHALFTQAGLLETSKYQDFLSKKSGQGEIKPALDLDTHYLLIGQFSGGRYCSPAWSLHQQNQQISWSSLAQQKRQAGLTSIVMPVFNQGELTQQAVEAVVKHTPQEAYELLLVDNGSDDTTQQLLRELEQRHPRVRVIRLEKNLFFALGSNQGFAQAQGEYTVFLNNDTQVEANWLDPLVASIKDRKQYAAQPLLLYPDGSVQCMGVVFSDKSNLGYPIYRGMQSGECNANKPRQFQTITAACMAIRSELFAKMQGFDPIYINGQEDIDLCLRLKEQTQQQAAYVPSSRVIHYESKTPGRSKYIDQNRRVFFGRWSKKLVPDDECYYQQDGMIPAEIQRDHKKNQKISAIKVRVTQEHKPEQIKTETTMTQPDLTLLQQANRAFREGQYQEAEEFYCQIAKHSTSQLVPVIRFNLMLSRKRQGLPHCDQTISALVPLKNQTFTSKQSTKNIKQALESALKDSLITKAHLTDLHNINTKENGFQATNDDPYFWITPSQSLKAGFYILELKLTLASKQSRYAAKIYKDYGQGFNENDTVVTSATSGKKLLRIVELKKDTQVLRFDPLETMSEFTVDAFKLAPISEEQAEKAMKNALVEKNKPIPTKNLEYLKNLSQAYGNLFKVTANQISYEEWIERVELPSLPSAKTRQQTLADFKTKPVFSVVMPTYNTDEPFLRLCIESVIKQSYPHWELCIADDCSPKPHVVKVLAEYAAQDNRIKIVKRKQNGHISKATNSAIDVAMGDFIVLLDHDDELAEHALYFMAEAINQHPQAKILYSDEDKIDTEGNRSNPHFKSDWNPDLFFSQNYVSHLGVYKADIIKKIGGFRTGVEGSQDQDLLLRCLPHVKHNEIHHIPRVLYHWRMIEGSTAMASGEKSYTTEAGIKALQDYFNAQGPKGTTVQAGLVANTYKVNWPIPKVAPKVSLLIPTRDYKTVTEVAVRSILEKTTYPNYEIVILDNGSIEPETHAFFKDIQKDKRVTVLPYDYPFNYSAINNYGVKHTNGEIIGLINNDVEVINPEWLTGMVSHAIRPDIGCVGAKMYYGNEAIQHAGVVLGIGGVASHPFKNFTRNSNGYFNRLKSVQNYSAVTAACLLVKRELYNQVGGLNEKKLKVAYNDVDFCLKVNEAGYRNLWTPFAELYHHESISRGNDQSSDKLERLKTEREYMLYRWADILEHDPYYNNNLTRNNDEFIYDYGFSRKLDFDNNLFYKWKAEDHHINKKYACIFVGFDAESKLHDYVVFYLEKLKKYFDIFYVTTAESMHNDPATIEKLQSLCKAVVVRKNEGYDFGSWKLGLEKYSEEIKQYDGLLLANDSVYGPLYDLNSFIQKFENKNCDVLGMTDSNELDFHLQSYFVMYKAKVLTDEAFTKFWDNVSIQGDKWDIIKKYEIGLSQRLMRYCGYNLQAYCDMKGYPNLNHTHAHWRDLITKKQYPFIKIELVKKNPFHIDVSDMEKIVKDVSDYDFSLIKNHEKD